KPYLEAPEGDNMSLKLVSAPSGEPLQVPLLSITCRAISSNLHVEGAEAIVAEGQVARAVELFMSSVAGHGILRPSMEFQWPELLAATVLRMETVEQAAGALEPLRRSTMR